LGRGQLDRDRCGRSVRAPELPARELLEPRDRLRVGPSAPQRRRRRFGEHLLEPRRVAERCANRAARRRIVAMITSGIATASSVKKNDIARADRPGAAARARARAARFLSGSPPP
jgi:hypothetical protein